MSDLNAIDGVYAGELARIADVVATIDDPQGIAWNALATAWVCFAEGRLDEAFGLAERAAGATEFYAPEAHPLAARTALRLGDRERVEQAVGALEASGARGSAINADRLTMAAGAAALRGDRPESRRLYHEALERWRSLGLSWDLALCQADYAMLLGDETDAQEQAAEARATFSRLGAAMMVVQLDDHPARARRPACRFARRVAKPRSAARRRSAQLRERAAPARPALLDATLLAIAGCRSAPFTSDAVSRLSYRGSGCWPAFGIPESSSVSLEPACCSADCDAA